MRLLIDKLLAEGAVKAAKKVVSRPPGPLSSALHMKVLLANENITEAFQIARLDDDEDGQPLLERFFRHCIEIRRFKVLAELYLREPEERLLYSLLRQCRSRQTDCVQLIMLLQKSKFIEAVSFMDEVAAERERDVSSNTILPAYSATMGPVTQNIAGTYLRIRDTLEPYQKTGPLEPFSCQLVKQNASGQLGGIFQSSAVSAHWATQCESPPKMTPVSIQSKIGYTNVPFLRHAQYGHSELPLPRRIVKPVPHQVVEKRQRELEDQRTNLQDQRQLGTERPNKRPCLMVERMVEDVKDYVRSIREKSSNQMEQEEVKQNEATNLLQPPNFLQARQSTTIRQSSSSPQPIPPILKGSGAVDAVKRAPPVATFTALAGPKRFRFVPPIPLRTDKSDKSTEMGSEGAAEGEEETDEIIVEIESRSEPRSACSYESDEEDEFLSPLVSANVSLVDPVPSRNSPHYFAPPAGPQPRNSLLHGGNGSGSKIGTATGSESSSGFGSFSTVQPAQTSSHSQFVPTVCSSKMGETQSQVFSSGSCGIKISERTTICGEMESTDLGAELTAAPSAQWSLPSARPAIQGHHQMMDTTLGMSTYDVASLEQQDTQDVENEEELKLGDTKSLEEQQNPQDEQKPEQEQDQDEDQAQEPLATGGQLAFLSNSEGTAQEPLSSPIYSLSSEDSNVSSAGIRNPMLPTLHTDDPMYSIVVESPGSITTSRSVTHTPTSFLPSDTNVSQTSSPQAPHGEDGDGTPISLYRANSLETVDDLDTTKGSLEEEEEYDDDDCVIALDGTEVRGYVARPQQSAASSSAELFAFKDECQEEAAGVPSPFLSLGATVNSDSDVADTIVLDSDEETAKEKDTQPEQRKDWPMEEETPSNESVATVEFSEQKQPRADMDIGMEVDAVPDVLEVLEVPEMEPLPVLSDVDIEMAVDEVPNVLEVLEVPELEPLPAGQATQSSGLGEIPEEDVDAEAEEQVVVKVEHVADEQPKEGDKTESKEASEEETQHNPEPLLPEEEDSRHSLKLIFSGDEDEEEQDVPTRAIHTLRPRRSFTEHQDSPRTLRPRRVSQEHRDSPTPVAGRTMSLRSTDAPTLSPASNPPVSTPKRRGLQHKYLLEVIDEHSPSDLSLPRTRSRTRLSVDSEATSSRPGTPTMTKARGKRATSQAPPTASPSVRRSLRGHSEPPAALSAQLVRKPKTARAGVRSRKTSSGVQSPVAVSPTPIDAPIDVPDSTAPEEEQPRLRRTARRRISELSDQSANGTGDLRSEASSSRTGSKSNSAASTQNRELRPRLRRTSKSEH